MKVLFEKPAPPKNKGGRPKGKVTADDELERRARAVLEGQLKSKDQGIRQRAAVALLNHEGKRDEDAPEVVVYLSRFAETPFSPDDLGGD